MSCAPVAVHTTTPGGAIGRIMSAPANTVCTTRTAGTSATQPGEPAHQLDAEHDELHPVVGLGDQLDLRRELAQLLAQRSLGDEYAHARESNVADVAGSRRDGRMTHFLRPGRPRDGAGAHDRFAWARRVLS